MTRRTSSSLVLLGILLLSLNLRPAAVSVGPVLADVRAGLGLGAATAGLVTSLPVVAFAVFGALAPAAARRIGAHRVTLACLVAVALGLAGRALAGGEVAFLLLSLVALAGMAMANVLLPSLVKAHFPDRIGRITALYTTALSVGLTGALLLTVPISQASGSWRGGLGSWALLAVLAAVPWVALAVRDGRREPDAEPDAEPDVEPAASLGPSAIARTRLGWAMAAFFGLQSLQAYAVFGWFATLWRDAGFSPTAAGALVGLVAATSIPLSLWAPAAVARPGDQRRVLVAIMACYPVGYTMLMLAPHTLAVPAAVVVGVGTATFPVVLVLIGLRARTPEGTAALSGFTQSTGYLLAAAGPFAIGVLHDSSGGWTVPLIVLTLLALPQIAVGVWISRPAHVEDELGAPDPR